LPALLFLLVLALAPLAIWGLLSPVSDIISALKLAIRRPRTTSVGAARPRLLLLVPAHNEAALIQRCVTSLRGQDHPPGALSIVVLADNSTDETAKLAQAVGATVLVRTDPRRRGKGHAIGWALERLDWPNYDAVVILDADTTIDPDYYHRLAESAPLRSKAVQCYDGLSNENENWLTLLAGMITRNRYDLALPLKQAAGLRVPLTGDGTLIGVEILKRHGWRADSLTEGWDLYARLTLAGERIELAGRARIFAQEARSLEQAGSQRARWSSGRASVLRENWTTILTTGSITLHQKLDLFAELSSPGPVLTVTIALLGLVASALFLSGWARCLLMAAFAGPLVQQGGYTLVSLARHPQPLSVLGAALHLPFYAAWRMALATRLLAAGRPKEWARTARHEEGPGS
jgi:1,2-diacylglycerol 3-beta-glucosyltransferase